MPKENVYDVNHQKFLTHVGWNKESESVQIATVAPTMPLVQDASTAEHNGWFVQLDRNGINTLIRHLRKARDQAFGADA